jgi:hypothetical protein
MLQQILFTLAEVEAMVAGAYQKGVNAGYMMAVNKDMLELEAQKREREREAIIKWQDICESREGDECGHAV